jgi:GTP-binding protein YchF
VINTELMLADLASVEKAVERAGKQAKTGRKDDVARRDFLEKLRAHLDAGNPARTFPVPDEYRPAVQELFLLTAKPVMYVANVDEKGLGGNTYVEQVRELAKKEGAEVVVVCAAIEAEIAQLDEADKQAFLQDLGLDEPGLNRVIRAGYRLLGLQTYFTVGPKEARAWTIPVGATAPQAAGVIHTDFEKGFIRAEVIAYDDYIAGKGEAGARDAGRLRLEGKEYVMQEGDVVHFRFNV